MRHSTLRALLALGLGALSQFGSSTSVAEPQGGPCDINPRGAVEFANASFNLVRANGDRDLAGNAFAIFAEPTATFTGQGENRKRIWSAIMVTAAHVVDDVCGGFGTTSGLLAGGSWRLTLAPTRGVDFQSNLNPVEAQLNARFCESRNPAPHDPDLVLFEQTFELPAAAVMRPYVVANPRAREPGDRDTAGEPVQFRDVEIRGFRPRRWDDQSVTPVYQRVDGLDWGIPLGGRLYIERRNGTSHYRIVLQDIQVLSGQSGSPVVSKDEPYLVYGVLTERGTAPACGAMVARADDGKDRERGERMMEGEDDAARVARPAGEEASARGRGFDVSEEECEGNQDIENARTSLQRMAEAALLVDSLADYGQQFSTMDDQRSLAHVEAAVTLYQLQATAPSESLREIEQALTKALERLNAIEQVRFWSVVGRTDNQRTRVHPSWMCIRFRAPPRSQ